MTSVEGPQGMVPEDTYLPPIPPRPRTPSLYSGDLVELLPHRTKRMFATKVVASRIYNFRKALLDLILHGNLEEALLVLLAALDEILLETEFTVHSPTHTYKDVQMVWGSVSDDRTAALALHSLHALHNLFAVCIIGSFQVDYRHQRIHDTPHCISKWASLYDQPVLFLDMEYFRSQALTLTEPVEDMTHLVSASTAKRTVETLFKTLPPFLFDIHKNKRSDIRSTYFLYEKSLFSLTMNTVAHFVWLGPSAIENYAQNVRQYLTNGPHCGFNWRFRPEVYTLHKGPNQNSSVLDWVDALVPSDARDLMKTVVKILIRRSVCSRLIGAPLEPHIKLLSEQEMMHELTKTHNLFSAHADVRTQIVHAIVTMGFVDNYYTHRTFVKLCDLHKNRLLSDVPHHQSLALTFFGDLASHIWFCNNSTPQGSYLKRFTHCKDMLVNIYDHISDAMYRTIKFQIYLGHLLRYFNLFTFYMKFLPERFFPDIIRRKDFLTTSSTMAVFDGLAVISAKFEVEFLDIYDKHQDTIITILEHAAGQASRFFTDIAQFSFGTLQFITLVLLNPAVVSITTNKNLLRIVQCLTPLSAIKQPILQERMFLFFQRLFRIADIDPAPSPHTDDVEFLKSVYCHITDRAVRETEVIDNLSTAFIKGNVFYMVKLLQLRNMVASVLQKDPESIRDVYDLKAEGRIRAFFTLTLMTQPMEAKTCELTRNISELLIEFLEIVKDAITDPEAIEDNTFDHLFFSVVAEKLSDEVSSIPKIAQYLNASSLMTSGGNSCSNRLFCKTAADYFLICLEDLGNDSLDKMTVEGLYCLRIHQFSAWSAMIRSRNQADRDFARRDMSKFFELALSPNKIVRNFVNSLLVEADVVDPFYSIEFLKAFLRDLQFISLGKGCEQSDAMFAFSILCSQTHKHLQSVSEEGLNHADIDVGTLCATVLKISDVDEFEDASTRNEYIENLLRMVKEIASRKLLHTQSQTEYTRLGVSKILKLLQKQKLFEKEGRRYISQEVVLTALRTFAILCDEYVISSTVGIENDCLVLKEIIDTLSLYLSPVHSADEEYIDSHDAEQVQLVKTCFTNVFAANASISIAIAHNVNVWNNNLVLQSFLEPFFSLDDYSNADSKAKHVLACALLDDLDFLNAVCESCPVGDTDELARSLMSLAKEHKKVDAITSWAIDKEFDKADIVCETFRRNSVHVKLLCLFIDSRSGHYNRQWVKDLINALSQLSKSPDTNSPESFDAIMDAVDSIRVTPSDFMANELAKLYCYIRDKSQARFTEKVDIPLRNLVFLRIICPLMVTPQKSNVIDYPLTTLLQSQLISVARMIQKCDPNHGTDRIGLMVRTWIENMCGTHNTPNQDCGDENELDGLQSPENVQSASRSLHWHLFRHASEIRFAELSSRRKAQGNGSIDGRNQGAHQQGDKVSQILAELGRPLFFISRTEPAVDRQLFKRATQAGIARGENSLSFEGEGYSLNLVHHEGVNYVVTCRNSTRIPSINRQLFLYQLYSMLGRVLNLPNDWAFIFDFSHPFLSTKDLFYFRSQLCRNIPEPNPQSQGKFIFVNMSCSKVKLLMEETKKDPMARNYARVSLSSSDISEIPLLESLGFPEATITAFKDYEKSIKFEDVVLYDGHHSIKATVHVGHVYVQLRAAPMEVEGQFIQPSNIFHLSSIVFDGTYIRLQRSCLCAIEEWTLDSRRFPKLARAIHSMRRSSQEKAVLVAIPPSPQVGLLICLCLRALCSKSSRLRRSAKIALTSLDKRFKLRVKQFGASAKDLDVSKLQLDVVYNLNAAYAQAHPELSTEMLKMWLRIVGNSEVDTAFRVYSFLTSWINNLSRTRRYDDTDDLATIVGQLLAIIRKPKVATLRELLFKTAWGPLVVQDSIFPETFGYWLEAVICEVEASPDSGHLSVLGPVNLSTAGCNHVFESFYNTLNTCVEDCDSWCQHPACKAFEACILIMTHIRFDSFPQVTELLSHVTFVVVTFAGVGSQRVRQSLYEWYVAIVTFLGSNPNLGGDCHYLFALTMDFLHSEEAYLLFGLTENSAKPVNGSSRLCNRCGDHSDSNCHSKSELQIDETLLYDNIVKLCSNVFRILRCTLRNENAEFCKESVLNLVNRYRDTGLPALTRRCKYFAKAVDKL